MLNKVLNFVDGNIHSWLDDKAPVEYRKGLTHLAVGFIAILFSFVTITLVIIYRKPPPINYYYMTPAELKVARAHGPIEATPFIVSDAPSLSHQKIQMWLSKALTRSLSFNFANADDVINSSSEYFTPDGYVSYVNALNFSKYKENIVKSRLVSNLTVTSDPIYTMSPVQQGENTVWQGIETKALITYTGASTPLTKKVIITAELIQSPTWKTPQGLVIQSITITNEI